MIHQTQVGVGDYTPAFEYRNKCVCIPRAHIHSGTTKKRYLEEVKNLLEIKGQGLGLGVGCCVICLVICLTTCLTYTSLWDHKDDMLFVCFTLLF